MWLNRHPHIALINTDLSTITNFNRSPINTNEVILILPTDEVVCYNDSVVDDDREVHRQPTSQKLDL